MGSEARARVGLVFLLLVTLFAFSQLFGEGEYSGPSLLAMAFALGITIGMRRLGAGSGTTIAVSLTAMLGYLSWIFEGRNAWFLLPTPSSLQGLGDSIGVALDKAVVDYAPVPVRPGYVILTAAALWVLTTLGEVATFRWRKPLVASLGSIALFSFVTVVGTREGSWLLVAIFLVALFTYWSLEAAHRLRSWGSWVSAWEEDHDEPPVLTHSTARRMGASSILVALVAPLFTPAIGDAVLSWKSGLGDGPGTGGGIGGRINPLVSIEPRIVQQSDDVMFTVTTEEVSRWKLVTLESYDGRSTWTPAHFTTTAVQGGVLPSDPFALSGDPEAETTKLSARIDIAALEGASLPVPFPPTEVHPVAGLAAEDLRANAENGDVTITGELNGDVVYEVDSAPPDLRYEDFLGARPGRFLPPEYTSIGPLDPEVEALRDEWTEGSNTAFERLVAIQDRLRGPEFAYDLEIGVNQENADPADPLADFLLRTRTGYCQQFATSFAVLSRSLGYPTRIAVGFLPGSRQDPGVTREDAPLRADEKIYEVTGTDAHAWPEVYFQGIGWVAFEPTPRTDRIASAPTYTSEFVPDDPFASGASESRQTGNPREEEAARERAREEVRADGTLDGEASDETVGEAWKEPFARLSLTVLVLAILFLIAVPSLKAWRVESRYRKASTPAARAAAAFAEFQLEARELAARQRSSESAPSYARRVSDASRLDEDAALRLASIYERATYGGAEIEPNIADEAKRIARALRSSLWQSAGWWQRMQRLFSPTGLRT